MEFPFVKRVLMSELFNARRELKAFTDDCNYSDRHPLRKLTERDIRELETVLDMINEKEEEKNNE